MVHSHMEVEVSVHDQEDHLNLRLRPLGADRRESRIRHPHKSTEGEGVAAPYSPNLVEGVFSEVHIRDPAYPLPYGAENARQPRHVAECRYTHMSWCRIEMHSLA